MFILATTETAQVPATIKSRCHAVSFKRILPGEIAARLSYVRAGRAWPDGEGAALLARLADGGLRDALSLLDQCAVPAGRSASRRCWTPWAWRAIWRPPGLWNRSAEGIPPPRWPTLARLYSAGKDVGSLLGELSALARDLLVRRRPPGGAGLLTGGCDENTMRRLSNAFPPRGWYRCWALQATAGSGPQHQPPPHGRGAVPHPPVVMSAWMRSCGGAECPRGPAGACWRGVDSHRLRRSPVANPKARGRFVPQRAIRSPDRQASDSPPWEAAALPEEPGTRWLRRARQSRRRPQCRRLRPLRPPTSGRG